MAVNFLPSLLEPILYLFAFGFGLRRLHSTSKANLTLHSSPLRLVAIAIMNGSFFECTFASFVRMYFQKTFDAIVATPVSVEEVVAGELLWGATRATINSTIVLAVSCWFFRFRFHSPAFSVNFPIAFFGGLMFASIAMCFTAARPNIDFFNFPSFPIPHAHVFFMRNILPLNLFTNSCTSHRFSCFALNPNSKRCPRHIVSGHVEPILGLSPLVLLLVSVVWIIVVTVFFFILSINLMKKRRLTS